MTKKHSKYYIGRIKRDFPSVEYEYQESGDVRKDSFDTVCELSRSRMKFKNKVYSSNADNDTRLFNRITEDNGFVSLVKIDERIVAGCAGFIFNEHLYLCKIAHDVELNNYNVGQVALLKLIEWCIEVKKVKEFHYLWGKNVDYKDRFGGNTYPLYNYYIYPYRSPLYYNDYFNLKFKGLLNGIKDTIRKHQALMKWYHRFTYRNENYT